MVIAFVVLHYQNVDVTNKCLDLLLSLENIEQANIVVVDNASPNKSGMDLKRQYSGTRNVHVLINTQNGGFALGNNFGYEYAKRELKADIIVVMNSDVYIHQKDFISQTINAFMATNADIIAPQIYALKGFYQNPLGTMNLSRKKAEAWLKKVQLLYALVNLPVFGELAARALQKKHDDNDNKKKTQLPQSNIMYDVIPHGACIIFGHRWVEREEFAFVPKTFMYCEEYLLSYYADKEKYTIAFIPYIQVEHEAGASSKVEYSKIRKQFVFFYRNEIKSIKGLINLMDQE